MQLKSENHIREENMHRETQHQLHRELEHCGCGPHGSGGHYAVGGVTISAYSGSLLVIKNRNMLKLFIPVFSVLDLNFDHFNCAIELQ